MVSLKSLHSFVFLWSILESREEITFIIVSLFIFYFFFKVSELTFENDGISSSIITMTDTQRLTKSCRKPPNPSDRQVARSVESIHKGAPKQGDDPQAHVGQGGENAALWGRRTNFAWSGRCQKSREVRNQNHMQSYDFLRHVFNTKNRLKSCISKKLY